MANPELLNNRLDMLAAYWPFQVQVDTPWGRGYLKNLLATRDSGYGPVWPDDAVVWISNPTTPSGNPSMFQLAVDKVKPVLWTLDQLEHVLPEQGALRAIIQDCVPLSNDGPYGEYLSGPVRVEGSPHQITLRFQTWWNPDLGDEPHDDDLFPEGDPVYANYELLLDNTGTQLYRQVHGEVKDMWQPATGGLYLYHYLRSLHVAVGAIFPAYHSEPQYFVRKQVSDLQEGGQAS